jgi:ferredoxin
MKRNMPGFSLLDYAFSGAALTVAQASYSGRGNMNSGFYSWSPLEVTRKPEDVDMWRVSPSQASKVVKKAGKYYGATDVGFCELDKRWVYSHTSDGRPIVFEDVKQGYVTEDKAVIPESHKWVIAITVPMEVEEMMYSPVAMNPTSIPIAIQAGLGHLGRHGRLITWQDGPMVRIAKIFTDLPLESSELAPEGIIEFCEVCEKCAKMCPSKSIPFGPRTWEGENEANNNGAFKWYCNADTCLDYWREMGSSCSICFRVCNFTKEKGISHDIVKWFIRNIPQLNRFFVFMDEFIGYGKIKDPLEYWALE